MEGGNKGKGGLIQYIKMNTVEMSQIEIEMNKKKSTPEGCQH